MLGMEDKENEPQQERHSKLVVEPPVNQKPRRSVLKEFDPFAPDSPCPPKLKNSEKIDEEDDIFEDAETSLRKFGILLVPDLRVNQQEAKDPNCTIDLSYVEAAESLSEVEGLVSFDKTSSEEDGEFNSKQHNGNSDILVDNSDRNLLNISIDMDTTSGLTDGNIMVDSLEHIFNVSNRLNSSIENIESPIILSKTKPIEAQETSINIARNICELSGKVESRFKVELAQSKENIPEELGSMIDSLELPDLQNNPPISNSACRKNQYMLIDSLEILKSEEGLNTNEIMEKTPLTNAKASPDILANQLESDQINTPSDNVVPNITFESLSSNVVESKTASNIVRSKNNQLQNYQIDASNGNLELSKFGTPFVGAVEYKTDQIIASNVNELNQTFESPSSNNVASKTDELQSDVYSGNIAPYETFESPSSNNVESKTDELHSDVPSVNIEPNKTFESPSSKNVESKTDELQSDVPSVNIEPNKTFELPSSKNVESKTDELQSDVPNVNIEHNKSFESPSLNNVTSKTGELQSDVHSVNIEPNETFECLSSNNAESKTNELHNEEISTSIVNVESSQTNHSFLLDIVQSNTDRLQSDQMNNLEGTETFDGTSLDNVHNIQSKIDQFQCNEINTSNVNVELNETFETPSSNNVECKSGQRQNDPVITSITTCVPTEIQVVERDATADDKVPNKTVDSHENIQYTKQNSTQIIDSLNQTEENLQQLESNIKKEEYCNTEIAAFNKVLEAISDTTDTLIGENLNNQELCIDTDLKKTSKVLENIVEQTVESSRQEAIITSSISQSTTNDTHNVQNHSVSLKDIDIDTTFKDVIEHDNIKQITSHRHSFPPNCSEDLNLTFPTEKQAAESRRELDALAQSLNQTIDVEESAIVDDINSSKSTNTSGELTEEKLNVTIENVKESLTEQESVIGRKEDIKSEEKVEQTSIKILERKATEEFEDLERQFNEKAENTASCAEQEFGEQCSKAFYRQDTREFEVLERQYYENAKIINDCDSITGNNSEAHLKNNKAKEENIQDEEKVKGSKESQAINIQETQEFKDLKSDRTANLQTSKECSDDLKLNEGKTVEHLDAADDKETDNKNANTSAPGVKELINGDDLVQVADSCKMSVKVRVSGNICNANSVSSDFEQSKSKTTLENPFTGINLKKDVNVKKDLNLDVEDVTDNVPNSTKTDSSVAKEVPNSTNDKNVQVPRVNECNVRPKYKPECRPSTRSLRNQTQVIDKPVVINNDTSSEIKREEKDKSDEELQKSKSKDLMMQVDNLQIEIRTLKEKNKRMDKFVLTCALDTEAERNNVIKFKKVLAEYELTLASQNEELKRLKDEEDKSTKSFTSMEMAFADIFEKYEKAKSVIGVYKKNEEILQRNIQCAEDQLTKLEAKCSVTKEQYSKILKTVQEQMDQEKEKYRQSIAKLQAHIKRLEIKSSCLETSLRQKTDECRALAALCDDITGKPM